MPKFEVRKKYRGLLNPDCIVECFFVMPSGAAACSYVTKPTNSIGITDDVMISVPSQESGWKEYREPVKRWFNKYRIRCTGAVFLAGDASFLEDERTRLYGLDSKSLAEQRILNYPDKYEYLGTIEIEF